MKKIYLTALIFTIFFLFTYSVVSIAIPKEYLIAMKLERTPEKWDLTMNNDFEKSLENYEIKEELIRFIRTNKNNYDGAREILPFAITVLIFSLIGYLRERKIKKSLTRQST